MVLPPGTRFAVLRVQQGVTNGLWSKGVGAYGV